MKWLQDAQEIPFTLDGSYIVVEVQINDKPARLLLDTAAGSNLLTTRAASRLRIKPVPGLNALISGAGEKQIPAPIARFDSLVCGDARQKGSYAVILDLPDGVRRRYDGILGNTFLAQYAVRIDYARQRVQFLNREQAVRVSPGATVLPLQMRIGIPEVPVTIDGISGFVRVDTGYAGTLTFTTPTVEKYQLRRKYPKQMEAPIGQGLGGVAAGVFVRIKSLRLGEIELSDVTAGLSSDKSGALADSGTIALLGAEVLGRFTVTLDFPGKRLLLEKNRFFTLAFTASRSGFGGAFEGDDYRITTVVTGSPAAEAGVTTQDRLLAIDDQPVQKLGPAGIKDKVRLPVGTVLRLLLRAPDGKTRTVTLTLRDLL